MPDISLRFHKDMLVLTSPVETALRRCGLNTDTNLELTLLLEEEIIEDAYRLESMTGAPCFVTCTASLTPARLARTNMEDRGDVLAQHAFDAIRPFKPQHILAELGPCGLPLDKSSKSSLLENRDQYVRAAHLFDRETFDAFFLNGFTQVTELKCALMGIRKVSDAPIFASVDVDENGLLLKGRGETLEDAIGVMNEYGASVAGFAVPADAQRSVELCARATHITSLPLLIQLNIEQPITAKTTGFVPSTALTPDSMMDLALQLRNAGAQFIRATGEATPAYTGALVAATAGLDVVVENAHDTETDRPLADLLRKQESAEHLSASRTKVTPEQAAAQLAARLAEVHAQAASSEPPEVPAALEGLVAKTQAALSQALDDATLHTPEE